MRLLAIAVLVVGLLAVWGGFSYEDVDLDACPPVEETQGYTVEPQLWPPGTLRCEVSGGGQAPAERTYFPARMYAVVVLLALAVLVLRLRPLRMLASGALVLAAGAVFFMA